MKNPINFLLLLTLLFWIPQLLTFRRELKESNDLHHMFMSTEPTAPLLKPAGKKIVTGVSAAVTDENRCLIDWVRLYQGTEAIPSNMIFDKTRVADKFVIDAQGTPVTVNTDRIRMLSPPTAEDLHWKATPIVELPKNFFVKSDQVSEALELKIRATKPLLLEEACISYGQAVAASGFVSDKMEMNYTVSVPFTLFVGPIEAARAQAGLHVSRTYVMTALLSMLISFVGLLFFLNIMLRNRINLQMQPIPENLSPAKDTLLQFRTTTEILKNEASDFVQKLHPQSKDFVFAQYGNLPSFYRYHWDDGIDIHGRKALLAVTNTGLVIVEVDSKNGAKGMREVLWNDLFCVFFTNWGKQDTWVDIITREGERYQISFKDMGDLRTVLKRWDASEINLRKMAA